MTRGGRLLPAACLGVAVVRILLGSSAMPLFSPVDEHYHWDMVVRWARGDRPRGLVRFSPEAAAACAACSTWEYLTPPERVRPGTAPSAGWRAAAAPAAAPWTALPDRESFEPPAYFAVAGAWLRLGERLGLAGCRLVYWVRWLNAAWFGALLLVGAALAAEWAGDRPLVRIGVPVALALLPQDTWYRVTNDVPLALWGGAGFWLLARSLRPAGAGPATGAAGGACLGLAVLTKYIAVPVAAAVLLLPVLAVWRAPGRRAWRRALAGLAAAAACAGAPVAGWLIWFAPRQGLVGGMLVKFNAIGGVLPATPAQVLAHPLFTPAGAWTFVRDLTISVWCGQLTWHGVDAGRGLTAALVVLVTGPALLAVLAPARRRRPPLDRAAAGVALVAAATLAAISVSFDYSRCAFPSREYPYMTAGRLATAALLPLLFAVLAGLDRLARLAGAPRAGRAAAVLLAAGLGWVAVTDLARVAGSAFNWFHLP